jgi:hypothetical protein
MKECKYNDKLLKQIIYWQELKILIVKEMIIVPISLLATFSVAIFSILFPPINEIMLNLYNPDAYSIFILIITWFPSMIVGLSFLFMMSTKACDKFDEATK